MAKIRVHELSKQLNISNKDIIDTLGAKGIEIKSHMSNLDDSMVGIIKLSLEQRLRQKPRLQRLSPQSLQHQAGGSKGSA
ncbi:translation initiation factor IF-2 N-terminal domain-containing protein [Coprococcus sp. OM06-25]|uniref:translation initiation factor IF-2 N-terminal domain-containing protein n=1 Tax=Coprococcus sp. OM06-25 TaxID=2293094 RepID=UPI001FA8CCDA|nr:translation initiation factor IF-2 N-terminal domain-containing protein [Coprococcus sp. OM06-25]